MDRGKIIRDLFGENSEAENEYGGSEHENEIKAESHGESEPSEVMSENAAGRSHDDERDNEQVQHYAAVLRGIFRNFDDDQQTGHEHSVQNTINHDDTACMSTDDTGSHVRELIPWAISPDEGNEAKLKQKALSIPVVFEIPLHPPLAHLDKMAIFRVSSIIGIDPNPFDPSKYAYKELYVTDASGSRRLIPPANIIRWRKVTNYDGKTSVESNARFVSWSDGRLQLLIGSEAFDVSVQDIKHMESHLCLKHKEGILFAQGKVTKNLVVMPTSVSSRSHLTLATQVNSKNRKTSKVKYCIAEVDPEWEMEQYLKAEREKAKANKKRKKVMPNKRSKHHQQFDVPTLLLEYPNDEQKNTNQESTFTSLRLTESPFNFGMEKLNSREKNIPEPSGSISLRLADRPFNSETEKLDKFEKGPEGAEVENSAPKRSSMLQKSIHK